MDFPPPPAKLVIATMTAEQVDLYRQVPPPGHPIPAGMQPFPMDDSIPEDENIAWAVRRLFRNRPGGLSGLRAVHLHQWSIAATRDDAPDAKNWLKFVVIVQEEFCDGTLAEESTWHTVVLVTKGGSGDFRGVVLVELLKEDGNQPSGHMTHNSHHVS